MTQQRNEALASPVANIVISSNWEEKQALIRQRYPNAKNADIELLFHQAKRMGLDPLAGQIHLVMRKDNRSGDYKSAIQVGIDGYRAMADRTGVYAGNDDPLFDEGLNQYQMTMAGKKRPVTSTVTVYKVVGGVRCAFTATATWDAYCPKGDGDFMWLKMPFLMLAKCAEALALRKAFPAELSGVYTDAEMEQAGKSVTVTLDQPVRSQAALVAPQPAQAHAAAAKPVQAVQVAKPVTATPAAQPAAKVDVLNENAIDDFALVMSECDSKDEAERLHNKFTNSASAKNSPLTIGAAWDCYQKTLKRLAGAQ